METIISRQQSYSYRNIYIRNTFLSLYWFLEFLEFGWKDRSIVTAPPLVPSRFAAARKKTDKETEMQSLFFPTTLHQIFAERDKRQMQTRGQIERVEKCKKRINELGGICLAIARLRNILAITRDVCRDDVPPSPRRVESLPALSPRHRGERERDRETRWKSVATRVSLTRTRHSRRFYFSHERRAFESDLAPCSAGSAKKEEKE